MGILNKENFLKSSISTLENIYNMLDQLSALEFNDLNNESTLLVIVDMVNGFTREGALKSSRVEEIIPEIARLSRKCDVLGIKKLAFADCHTNASPEFNAYPVHCLADSSQGEIVDEIREIGGYTLIPKNSTNGFLEEVFQKWLMNHSYIDTFIITGDCTDICIQQLAITLKTWFNMYNKQVRIIVPMNAVDTYDLELHDGDLMHVMALYNMMINGIEIVKSIK